ncbi:hypothetical protein N173_19490 [Acinetobacter baumannii EGD-HP18]|uniref:Uncharacterized protein n=1 Tax=Acinetobacter baumannii EGD-HP18 TaxID=1358412 RepID=A0AAV3JX84_ACIBA|nr:hypothetical protein N173_19490 [Acinetobacter baumannii EGD-HP18]
MGIKNTNANFKYLLNISGISISKGKKTPMTITNMINMR